MEEYIELFQKVFEVKAERVRELEYKKDGEWDSIGHMELVTAIEDAFDIILETEDIIALTSFQKGLQILSRYGIELKDTSIVEK